MRALHGSGHVVAGMLFSVGGVIAAYYVGSRNPRWCDASYVGCFGAMVSFLVGGWLLGVVATCFAFWRSNRFTLMRRNAWLLFWFHWALAAMAVAFVSFVW